MEANAERTNVVVRRVSEEADVKSEIANMRNIICHMNRRIKRLFVRNIQRNVEHGDGKLVLKPD